MEGIVYSTKYGLDSIFHEQGKIILEIWFEKMNICVNENNEVIRQDSPRRAINHFGTIDFPDKYCQMVKTYLESKEAFEASNLKVVGAMKQRLMKEKNRHYKTDF
jgi:hypothetical protein